jgi:oxalyl-CoA decarboxylase
MTMTSGPRPAPSIDGVNLVVDALRRNDVRTIYGVVGIPITDLARVAQAEGIRFLGFRQEQAAGHAAAAAGFLTGRPGVALTVSAPGFLNGLVALANATTNCFPMVQISGSSDRGIVDLQQGDYEELDQLAIAKPLVKAAFRVERPEQIGVAVARALRVAASGRPGGVYLDLPAAVLRATLPAEDGAASLFRPVDLAPAQPPDPAAVDRALDLLAGAQRPLAVLGKGAAYARAEAGLRAFLEATGIPFIPMSMGKGLLPDDHRLCAAAARSLALAQADVVLLVGARLNWLLAHGRPPRWSPDARFVQLDIDAGEIDSNRPIAAPVVGDLRSSVDALRDRLRPGRLVERTAWTAALDERKATNQARMAERTSRAATPMDFFVSLGAVQEVLAEHDEVIVVNEGANTLDTGRDLLARQEPRTRLDSGTWGVMGVGLGYAIAAAVETGRPVLAVEGDSAFGFSGMELETICRYRLPVVVLVMNNGGVYRGDDTNDASDDPAPTVLLQSSRHDRLMAAFGGRGRRVETRAELQDALREAFADGGPALIDVVVDPTAGTESGHLTSLNAISRAQHADGPPTTTDRSAS